MPTPTNFIEVDIVQAVPAANTNVSPPVLTTAFKAGKMTFNPNEITSYGEYWDPNVAQFINGKTQVTLGLTGFIYNGTVLDFEDELPAI